MNFRKLTGFVLSATLLMSLSSCTKTEDSKQVDAAKIMGDSKLTTAEKAEQLAKAAEQLMSYQGFAYAAEVADLALQFDSSNLRAQFIKAMLGPIMVNEGVYARVAPLMAQDTETAEKYDKDATKFKSENPNSTIKTFLLNGAADIKDEKDVQKHLDAVADSFKALRLFAKNNKNAELTLTATDSMMQNMGTRYGQSCETIEVSKNVYQSKCPSSMTFMEAKMNRADFEALQHAAAGYELIFSLYNSYDLAGSIAKAIEYKGKAADSKVIADELFKNKDFGILRAGNGFSRLKEMGLDGIAGSRWVVQNQATLCAHGQRDGKNRIGMLLNEGLCADRAQAEVEKGLKEAEEGLNGQVKTVEISTKEGIYKTQVKGSALLDTPIKDLRSVAPTSYNACGNALSIADATLSGILVNGDANTILLKQSGCAK